MGQKLTLSFSRQMAISIMHLTSFVFWREELCHYYTGFIATHLNQAQPSTTPENPELRHNFSRQICRFIAFNKFFLLLFRSLGCYFEFGRPILSNLRGQFCCNFEDRFQRKSVRGVYPKSSRSDRRFHSGMFDVFLNT